MAVSLRIRGSTRSQKVTKRQEKHINRRAPRFPLFFATTYSHIRPHPSTSAAALSGAARGRAHRYHYSRDSASCAAMASEVAAAAAAAADERPSFSSLTHPLLHLIFARLPVDQRLRAAEVCTGWCAALSEPRLWRRLDLAQLSCTHVKADGVLRAAAARARGELEALDASACWSISRATLLSVVTANAGALRELSVRVDVQECVTLLAAAPHLRVFRRCGGTLEAEALALARAAPQLDKLHLEICEDSPRLRYARALEAAAHALGPRA
jgi:hypothetical protein